MAATVAVDRDGVVLGRRSPSSEYVDGLVVRSAEDLDALSDDDVARNTGGH